MLASAFAWRAVPRVEIVSFARTSPDKNRRSGSVLCVSKSGARCVSCVLVS